MNRTFVYALTGAALLTFAACDRAPPPAPKPAAQKDKITPTPPPPQKPAAPALPEPKGASTDPMKK